MTCPKCGVEATSTRVDNLPTRQVHTLSCGHQGQINANRGAVDDKHGTEIELSRATKNRAGDVIGFEQYTARIDTRELILVEEDVVATGPVLVDHRIAQVQMADKK